jgi:hypothetical protein
LGQRANLEPPKSPSSIISISACYYSSTPASLASLLHADTLFPVALAYAPRSPREFTEQLYLPMLEEVCCFFFSVIKSDVHLVLLLYFKWGVQWRMALFTLENGEKAWEFQLDLKHIIAFSFEDSHQKLTNRYPIKNKINK